jgi:hypothetical protein
MMTINSLDFKKAHEISKIRSALAKRHFEGMSIYPEFLMAVTATHRIRGHYLYCLDADEITGVASFYEKPNLFGKNTLVSVPGGFWAADEASEGKIIDAIKDIAAHRGFDGPAFKDLHYPLFTMSSSVTAFRAIKRLSGNEQELLSSYSKNIRRDLKYACKHQLRIVETSDTKPFYAVWAQNLRDLGTPPIPLSCFQWLQKCFREETQILLVQKGEEVIGGAFLLFNEDYAADIYLSSLRSAFKFYPNIFLYHEMFVWAGKKGIHFFDLGRSQYGGGNEKFKLRFGSELVPLYSYPVHEKNVIENFLEKLLPQIWKRMPICVSNQIGPFIRRYKPFA